MIIKAKYPKTNRWYMHCDSQGYGAYRGGNISNITQIDSRESDGQVESTSTGYMFGGGKVSIYINDNTGTQLIFVNQSVFILSQSDLTLDEIDTERALEFINDSNWAPVTTPDTKDVLLASLRDRAEYFENELATRALLQELQNCETNE